MYSFCIIFIQLFLLFLLYQPTLTVDKSKLKIKSFHLIDRKKNPFLSNLHPPKYSTISFIAHESKLREFFFNFICTHLSALSSLVYLLTAHVWLLYCYCCWALYNTLNPPSQLSFLPFSFSNSLHLNELLLLLSHCDSHVKKLLRHTKNIKTFFFIKIKRKKKILTIQFTKQFLIF